MNEQLTARSPKNGMAYLVNVRENEQAVDGSYNTLMCIRDSWEKLAKYEETGLSPSEIDGLKAASKEAAEILGDMVDVANATGSAYLYRRDTENVLRVVNALEVGDKEPRPDRPPSKPDGSVISQEIKNILHDMRNMPDGSTYSIALVREMLHSLLDEEGGKDDAP